jgi:hypothetical protein
MPYYNQTEIRSIRSLIFSASSSNLASICKHAEFIHRLDQELKKLLPSPIRDHCILGNIKNDNAIFHTRSSAWAVRLRLSAPEILDILHGPLNLPQVKSIRIKVSLADSGTQCINRRPKPTLSRDAANLIRRFAESIPHAALRSSLKKLSQNTGGDQ